jgi:hypothetical protein
MAGLMNWPPSRGPNPNAHQVSYKQGKITREDVALSSEEEPAARAPIIGKWYVWFQIEDVAYLTLEQAIHILRGSRSDEDEGHCADDWSFTPVEKIETLQTLITYPLNTAVHLVIEPLTITRTWGKERPKKVTREMRLGYFLWVVAQEYVRIYEEAERYDIWGHAMSDLGFEGVVVHEDGTVDILMGS